LDELALVCFVRKFGGIAACVVAHAIVLAGCAGPSTPTQAPPPPPPPPDPPKISCPAPQTTQSLDGGAAFVTFAVPTVLNGQPPTTTTCTPASGSAFSIGQRTVDCTTTDALQRTDACSFAVTVLAPPKLSTTSFLAFGDSVTAGEDGQNSTAPTAAIMSARQHPSVLFPFAMRYPQVLQQSLSDRYRTQSPTVANQGLPGERAADRSAQSRFSSLVSSRQYSVALIMEGSNDLGERDDRLVSPAIDALRTMIRDAQSRNVRPYLATIPPMNPAACVPVCRGLAWSLVSGFNDNVRALATSEGVTLVDVYQGFGGNFAMVGPDGLHPSAEGYAKIADLFFQSIKQTLEVPSTAAATFPSRKAAARR
jgi:lysophospholipase L1-like esterase